MDIPWEMTIPDGTKCTDKDKVLKHWADSYEKLYNDIVGDFDEDFLKSMVAESGYEDYTDEMLRQLMKNVKS